MNAHHEYVWFGGQPLAQIETQTGAVHWYFNDHLGTPVLTTDATGAVDWRVEREPYGAIHTVRAGPGRHQPLAFPGQEDGGDLSYNVFRWYRPGWGKYSQADPMGFFGTTNLYEYVGGNPVKDFDEFGLLSKTQAEAAMGIANLTWYFEKMKDKNFIGADKYYHCMGHCSATKMGPGGFLTSLIASYGKELIDFPKNLVKKQPKTGEPLTPAESWNDCKTDLDANELGQNTPPHKSCHDQCKPLLPKGFVP